MTADPLSSSGSEELKRRLFTLALLLSTWIPMAFFITVGSLGTPNVGFQTTKMMLLFLGGVHVPVTLLLYTDREFLRLAADDRMRYVYLPMALIIGSGLVFTFGGLVVQAYLYLIFLAWQAYHYGRQNIGVYSLASMAQRWSPRRAERRALELTIACAICGTFKILGTGVAPSYLHGLFDVLYRAGYVAFIGVLMFSIYIYVRNRRDFSLARAACFFTLVLFFFPIFLSNNMDGAFFSYAMAHGVQYLAFMGVLFFNIGTTDGRRGVSRRTMAMLVFVVLLGVVSYRAGAQSSLILANAIDFWAGMGLGATIAHFVIDAGAWRLSRPSARTYMAKRFEFLFKASPGESPRLVPSGVSSLEA